MSHILVLEDELAIQLGYQLTLTDAGYTVKVMSSGKGLLEAMPGVDLVITDIVMPNVDGMEVIKQLKERYPEVPIIAISGGGRVGADFYLKASKVLGVKKTLQKPIEPVELLDAVKAVLDQAST